jgi:hypothetical protein
MLFRCSLHFLLALLAPISALANPVLENASYTVSFADDVSFSISCRGSERTFNFRPSFIVVYSAADPGLALRPANLGTRYNVPTWLIPSTAGNEAVFDAGVREDSQHGDGFDDRILSASPDERRTDNAFRSGRQIHMEATAATAVGNTVLFQFPAHPDFQFKARLVMPASGYPELEYELVPVY